MEITGVSPHQSIEPSTSATSSCLGYLSKIWDWIKDFFSSLFCCYTPKEPLTHRVSAIPSTAAPLSSAQPPIKPPLPLQSASPPPSTQSLSLDRIPLRNFDMRTGTPIPSRSPYKSPEVPFIWSYRDGFSTSSLISLCLPDSKKEIFFTSGGTELRKAIPEGYAIELQFHLSLDPVLTSTQRNFSCHRWLFAHTQTDARSVNVPIGVFCAKGIRPTPNLRQGYALPIDRLQSTNVHMHPTADKQGLCLSPCNTCFEFTDPIGSFFAVVLDPTNKRALLSFHIFLKPTGTNSSTSFITEICNQSTSLAELHTNLETYKALLDSEICAQILSYTTF